MAISKPKMIKVETPLSKYVTGGKRSKTTKIAWHYTGANGVSAKSTVYNWFLPIAKGEHPGTYASAHFVMEQDGAIYQMIPMNYIAYTTNSANAYSIGIECSTTGSDDHYSEKEYVSMVKLGAWLAQEYNLDPREDFIRHYDVTKKICPRYFVNHSAKWKQFKLDCYNYMNGKLKESNIRNCTNGKGNSIIESVVKKVDYTVQILSNTLNIRKEADFDSAKIGELKKGDKVEIIKECNGLGYIEDKKGWISLGAKYVKKVEDEYIKIIRNIYGKPINVREVADWNAKACGTMKTDEVLTYVKTVDAKNGSTNMYLTKAGTYVTASDKYTKLDKIKKK